MQFKMIRQSNIVEMFLGLKQFRVHYFDNCYMEKNRCQSQFRHALWHMYGGRCYDLAMDTRKWWNRKYPKYKVKVLVIVPDMINAQILTPNRNNGAFIHLDYPNKPSRLADELEVWNFHFALIHPDGNVHDGWCNELLPVDGYINAMFNPECVRYEIHDKMGVSIQDRVLQRLIPTLAADYDGDYFVCWS